MVDFDHVQIIATILTLRSTVCDKNSLLNNAKKVTIEDLKTTGTFRIPANFCQEFNTPIRFRLNRKTIKKKKHSYHLYYITLMQTQPHNSMCLLHKFIKLLFTIMAI